MGLVPQGRRVFPSLTVMENLLVAAQGSTRPWTVERVLALFPRLQERIASRAGTLSRGRIVHSSVPEALWRNQEVKARYLGM